MRLLLIVAAVYSLACNSGTAVPRDTRWASPHRHLGRPRGALELTGPRRLTRAQGNSSGVSVGVEGINRVILDWMTGRPGLAARAFLEIARNQRSGSIFPGENARREAWWLTLAATTLVAAGDTASAAALVDSIRAVGARSSFGLEPVAAPFRPRAGSVRPTAPWSRDG